MSSIISDQLLAEFVRDKLNQYNDASTSGYREDTLWYVGNVLVHFSESKQLFTETDGETAFPALALLYGEAHAAESNYLRMNWLRKLGDTALFLGALFPEHLQRRGIGKTYFVGMGGGAYSYLAENFPAQNQVFSELSNRFPAVMQLMADICAKELAFDSQDIVALYERWHSTKNPMVKRQLNSLGILPIETSSKLN